MKKENERINFNKQKIEGLRGILYRLKMIYYLAYSISNKILIGSDKKGVSFALTRAPLESFLTHIRALNEFLVKLENKKTKNNDDLRACCYLGINEAKEFKERMYSFLLTKDESNAINKQLSHITTSEEIISSWEKQIPSFRERFFYVFCKFIKIDTINDLMKSVDRWNDYEYKEIRSHLEKSIIDQNDIKKLDNDTFYKSTIEKHYSLASCASSTGATPINSNSDQINDNNEKLRSKILTINKE